MKIKKTSAASGPKIARAYIRVSFQGDRGKVAGRDFYSPEMQLESARDYAKLHLPEYTFDEEASRQHTDIDKSASRLKWQKREGLVAHLEAARRGEFDALIVFKLSRFARNVREGWELFHEFDEAACEVHCIKDQLNTKTASGRLITSILLAVAEMESENIADWVSEAALKRARSGKLHAKQVFWLSKDDNGGYTLNDGAKLMRRMVDLTIQGHSHAETSRLLNKEGFRKPTGKLWTSPGVRSYLSADKILLLQGDYVFGLKKAEGDPGRIINRGAVPAVITEQEAIALAAINKRNAEPYEDGNQRRAASTTYVLSGIIRCAQCGDRLKSHTAQEKDEPSRPGYICRYGSDKNIPHPLGYSMTGVGLEDAVLRVVREAVIDSQEVIQKGALRNKEAKPKDISDEKKIEKLNVKIASLIDLYQNGHLKIEDFDTQYRPLEVEREQLRTRLDQDESEMAMLDTVNKAILDTSDANEMTVVQARQLVRAFVELVEAPVPVDHPPFSKKMKRKRKGAWVTLRFPLQDGTRRILAPIYDPRYKGERVLLERE